MDEATQAAFEAWLRKPRGFEAFKSAFLAGVEHGHKEGHNDAFVPGSSFLEKELEALKAKLAKLLAAARPFVRRADPDMAVRGPLFTPALPWQEQRLADAYESAVAEIGGGR